MSRRFIFSLMGFFIFHLFSIGIFAQANFQGLGDLPGGIFQSNAIGVSSDGSAVVGNGSSGNGTEAFLWTMGEGMVGLGDLPGGSFGSIAFTVSADGSVVVGSGTSTNGSEAFRWTVGGGMVGLGDLPGGSNNSVAYGVSSDGSVVVGSGSSNETGLEAFRWTAGSGMVGLGSLPGGFPNSIARSVSADGTVVVGAAAVMNAGEAFIWTAGSGMVGLGDLPGGNFNSQARGVSSDGTIVVGSGLSGNGGEAYIWTSGGGMVGLGDLPGGNFSSLAYAVSADGSVVVGSGTSSNGSEAFIWTDLDGMRNLKEILETDYGLDLTGWRLSICYDVSDDGTVMVGTGINPSGDTEAWRAVLPSNIVAWSNGQGGNFGVGSNWVGGAVPNTSQIALFDSSFYTPLNSTSFGANQPVTITFDDVTTTGGLDIKSPVNFDLQAHSYGVESLSIGSSSVTPDETELKIINGALGIDAGPNAVLIGAAGFKGQLMVSNGGIFEIDTDDPNGKLVIGANDCGSGECGRLIIQNGGKVFTNASGLGTTIIGTAGGDGSVFINDSEWSDASLVIIGENDTGILDISNAGSFFGNKLLLSLGIGSHGTVNISGKSGMHLEELVVGVQGTGEFSISDNVTVLIDSTFVIGQSSTGDVTISNQSELVSFGNMTVGEFGHGVLSLFDGGDLNSFNEVIMGEENGSTGLALVQGDSTHWSAEKMTIGLSGSGSLQIKQGGRFKSKGPVFLGLFNGSDGNVQISGSGSVLEMEEFTTVGLEGFADISISDSAFVLLDTTCFMGFGFDGEGEISVEGNDSKLLIFGTLFVGQNGRAGLSVLRGGLVAGVAAVIAADSGSIGSALVDGDSSRWFISSLRLGYGGVGFVRLTNSGTLEAKTVHVGPLGSIEFSGGNLFIGGNLIPPSTESLSDESLSDTSGTAYVDTLLVSEGAQILADSVIFGEGGYLGGEGSFTFDVINSGGLNPGDSINAPGLFTIDANYTQLTTGTLYIELEGNLPGSGFDQLVVNGDVQISGTLDVSALNVFEPQVGQTFEILTANNITGTFDNIITHSGLSVSVAYNSNNIIITVTSPVSVDDENNETIIPIEYNLAQNYPNPFNPSTKIKYSIPNSANLIIKVYNLLGKEVITLIDEHKQAGYYEVSFNAKNLSSGVYLYKIQAGEFSDVKKMILLK